MLPPETSPALARLLLPSITSAEGQTVTFGEVTVLLGANGAGKSNLVSFFRLLNFLTTGALQTFVADQGYAGSLLHFGSETTPVMSATLTFADGAAMDEYRFALAHAARDALIFTKEEITFRKTGADTAKPVSLGAGHAETKLTDDAKSGGKTNRFILGLLQRCRVFHFHDTSSTAKVRNQGYIEDNAYLRSNAGNLAAFLFALTANSDETKRKYYDRIVRHVSLAFPQFEDFVLKPSAANDKYILLNWRERGSDHVFGPHQLSDGTLRFMALTALLLQPPDGLPNVIVLDEPELGLHPSAISALAGMVRTAAANCQVVLATQSTRLVDEFDLSEVVLVERDERARSSVFRRLDSSALASWIERYSLSELWEKNVLGGCR